MKWQLIEIYLYMEGGIFDSFLMCKTYKISQNM